MKANEAPEKIYLYPSDRAGEEYENEWGAFPWGEGSVEYVRTDAFIEKALKWYCLDCECNDNCNANHKCFFRQEYKRYLEGAANALPPKFGNAINPDGGTEDNYRYRHFIRKMQDAFIEKACQFIKEHHHEFSFWNTEEYELGFSTQKFIEDFKNYMKGE